MVTMRRLSVKGIIQASEKTHTNQSDGFAEIVDSADSLRGDSPPPPHQLSSSSTSSSFTNQSQLRDRDLICCHSTTRPIRMTGMFMSCRGVDANQAGKGNSEASADSPLSSKAMIRN